MTSPNPTPTPRKRLTLGITPIVLVGLLALGIGLVVLDRTMRARRDRQTIQWAEQAMKEGRYEEAAAQYARAVARHPDDADLSVRSGDAFYALSASKPEVLQQARVAWQAAARIEPDDTAAVDRLLRFQIELAEVRPSLISFRELSEIAKTASSIAPTNKRASTAQLIATLGPWFSHVGAGTASESRSHEKLLNSLGDLVSQRPADDLAILYYALACSRRAVELSPKGASSPAQEVLNRAERLILSAANQDSHALYRAAEGLTILGQAYQRLDEIRDSGLPEPSQAAATQPAATQPAVAPTFLWPTWDMVDQQVRWQESNSDRFGPRREGAPTTRPIDDAVARCRNEAREIAARASASAQSSDDYYIDIRLLEVHLAEAAGDFSTAEQLCRQTLAARPANLRVELALADLVSESNPQQALAILEQPESPSDAVPGPVVLEHRDLLMRASKQKARLYLDAATAAEDLTVRQANIQKAAAECDALAALLINDADSLKLAGRLRMLQGKYTEAIRLLDRATAMKGRKVDVDLLAYRASTLLALREPQLALECLRRVLQIEPARAAERLLLTQTLIEEARVTEAGEQLSLLEKQLAKDPRALELRVRWLVAKNSIDPENASAESLQETYARLPETTSKQKLTKAELALSAGQAADAVRLLQPLHATEPSSVPVTVDVVRALIASNQADQAKGLLAEAIHEHASDPALVAVQKSLDRPLSPEAYEASLGGNAKGFLEAVRSCRAALEALDLPRAQEQIDSMTRLRPDEPLLHEMKFRYDLATQQWGDAALSADRLAQANFDGVEGLSYKLKLDVAREQPLAALGVARQLTRRYPQFAAGWLDQGRALEAVGRDDEAVGSFQHAIELDQNASEPIAALAASLEDVGRAKEADQWIAKGLRLAPADAELREMELVRQLSEGNPQRLIAGREAAVERESQRADNVIALARVYLQISRLEAISAPEVVHDAGPKLEDFSTHEAAHDAGAKDAGAKAVELLNDAIKKWPDDKNCSFWAAHATALAGDVAGGEQILRRLCDRPTWSKRPEAEQLLSEFCLIWGDPRSAETALRDAIARGARGVTAAWRLSAVSMQLGSWQPALNAVRNYPSDPLMQQQRIMIFLAAGHGADVETELKKALSSDPNNARLMSLLGFLYFTVHDDVRAKPLLDRAVEHGDEELACLVRGALSLRSGTRDLRQAKEDLDIAQESRPSNPSAALLLSELCRRDHDIPGAARSLETALSITPSDTALRLGLVTVSEEAGTPNWERIAALIEQGRSRAPSNWVWDATEARMWSARHEPGRAAPLMRYAVRVAKTAPEAADPTIESADVRNIQALIPEELRMLLEAGANDTLLSECDDVIARYGSHDMLSAWAHHAKASLQRRTGSSDGGTAEYLRALQTAQDASGFSGASKIVEAISSDAGADEAIRMINAYLGSPGGPRATSVSPHDMQWDLLRIDLLRRNQEIQAAATEMDKLMPHLAELPASVQIQVLRTAVVIYLQASSGSQSNKARTACLALLHRLPDDIWALNNMAAICIDHSNPSEPQNAIEYGHRAYVAAERIGAVDPQIVDTYGWALAAGGRGSEAIEMLKAIAPRLDIPDVQYHLAEAYLAAQDPRSAWPHLASAYRLIQEDEKRGQRVDPKLQSGLAYASWQALRQTLVEAFEPSIAP